MQLLTKAEYDVLKEQHTERWALKACQSTSFIQCLKAFDVVQAITVITPSGKSITISASQIYAARKRFFDGFVEQDLYHMTEVGDSLVESCLNWLLFEHTGRYRCITSNTHRKWLKMVIILVVARYLMGNKYTLYITQGQQTFADTWACSEMCRLQLLNGLTSELARLVYHIMDDPDQQQLLIDQFYTNLDIRMRGHLFVAPDSIPLLPEGTILPFSLLSQKYLPEM